jgi:hypothetical protein
VEALEPQRPLRASRRGADLQNLELIESFLGSIPLR